MRVPRLGGLPTHYDRDNPSAAAGGGSEIVTGSADIARLEPIDAVYAAKKIVVSFGRFAHVGEAAVGEIVVMVGKALCSAIANTAIYSRSLASSFK
ncbi:hypothetical protein [Chelativorans salis]|uniref:Uncharacterized protein n=1 Tax=Chelativorans salis TaxID=2978478 RepID=A0ABT2LTU1_9HYPH|nr:hypothetical protein [Chelativorans sp. EGI FJ00035]MCT7377957.1 hypothetical protein [Chelativorans sp. EGI FJ00035]